MSSDLERWLCASGYVPKIMTDGIVRWVKPWTKQRVRDWRKYERERKRLGGWSAHWSGSRPRSPGDVVYVPSWRRSLATKDEAPRAATPEASVVQPPAKETEREE